MPFTLFDYNPGSFHTMGVARPTIRKPMPTRSIPPKPKFKTAYNLTGTPPSKDWFYPACNAGYTKIPVFRPNPNAYSCFDPAEVAWNKKYGIVM